MKKILILLFIIVFPIAALFATEPLFNAYLQNDLNGNQKNLTNLNNIQVDEINGAPLGTAAYISTNNLILVDSVGRVVYPLIFFTNNATNIFSFLQAGGNVTLTYTNNKLLLSANGGGISLLSNIVQVGTDHPYSIVGVNTGPGGTGVVAIANDGVVGLSLQSIGGDGYNATEIFSRHHLTFRATNGLTFITGGSGLFTTNLSVPIAIVNGGTGGTNVAGARSNLGLGSMATQAQSNVQIDGGRIEGTTLIDLPDFSTQDKQLKKNGDPVFDWDLGMLYNPTNFAEALDLKRWRLLYNNDLRFDWRQRIFYGDYEFQEDNGNKFTLKVSGDDDSERYFEFWNGGSLGLKFAYKNSGDSDDGLTIATKKSTDNIYINAQYGHVYMNSNAIIAFGDYTWTNDVNIIEVASVPGVLPGDKVMRSLYDLNGNTWVKATAQTNAILFEMDSPGISNSTVITYQVLRAR